jgi:hypothetical protein
MILAFPLNVGLALPIFHNSSPWLALGAFLKESYFNRYAYNGRALSILTGKAGGLRNYLWN